MSNETEPTETDRRGLLRAAGSTVAALGLSTGLGVTGSSSVGSAAAGSGGRTNDAASPPSRFGVRGREIRRVQIRPSEVEVHTRKTSPALKQRYGYEKGTVSKTETFERPKPEADDLPQRDTRTTNERWETEIATADEWKEAFDRGAGAASANAALSATGPSYREDDYPFGVFEYEKTDGLFEKTAPMNVISPYAMSSVVDVLESNGYTGIVVQYNRHAFNTDTWQFETQHDSAATGTFGFLGRKHAKFWEFGGYVSCSAHVDSSVPHEAISHEDAEQHIEGIFDDVSGWYGHDDYYDLNNGSYLDHDGSATGLF